MVRVKRIKDARSCVHAEADAWQEVSQILKQRDRFEQRECLPLLL